MLTEALGVRRLGAIGARHLSSECVGNERQPAHSGTADADEMESARSPVVAFHGLARLASAPSWGTRLGRTASSPAARGGEELVRNLTRRVGPREFG